MRGQTALLPCQAHASGIEAAVETAKKSVTAAKETEPATARGFGTRCLFNQVDCTNSLPSGVRMLPVSVCVQKGFDAYRMQAMAHCAAATKGNRILTTGTIRASSLAR